MSSSSVSAHGASRNSSGSAASQPVSSMPASGWPPTNVAVRDEFAHRVEDRTLERADVGEHGAAAEVRRERAQRAGEFGQRHREHDEVGAVHGGGVGRRHREAGRAGRGGGRRVDVVADDLEAGLPHRVQQRAADQAEAEHRDAVEPGRCGHVARPNRPRRDGSGIVPSDFPRLVTSVPGSVSVARSREDGGTRGAAGLRGRGVPRRPRCGASNRCRRPSSSDLGVAAGALRSQPPEGGPFVIACVEDEFFVIARQDGARISLLLSDLTAAVEYPLAEQALARLGEDPPEDDELDEVWPVGDLELFTDLDLPEDEMEDILDDIDALPDEMLDAIVERIGIDDEYARATEAGAGRRH